MTTYIPKYICSRCKKVYALLPSPDGTSIYDDNPHPDIGKCLECKGEVKMEPTQTSRNIHGNEQ